MKHLPKVILISIVIASCGVSNNLIKKRNLTVVDLKKDNIPKESIQFGHTIQNWRLS